MMPMGDGTSESRDPSTAPTLVFDLAHRPDATSLLDRLYREILVPSFRRDELDPYEAMADSLTQSASLTDIAAAWKEPGEILGAIVGDWDPIDRVYLLSYLAVRAGQRSSGAGTSLMQQLPKWSRARGSLVTLAEVDDPRQHVADPSIGDPSARLSFYGRFGAQVLDLPYFQPRLTASGQRAHGMLLLAFDVDADALVPGAVPALRGDIVGGFLHRYFADAEGSDETRDDPDLTRLLDRASSPAGVRLLPLERHTEVDPDFGGADDDAHG
jgi:GNAT superfamily N-acetyltransferase